MAPARGRLRPQARWGAALVVAAALALLVGAAPADAHRGGGKAAAAKVLKRGAKGPAVVALQRRLRISADGIFGRGTAKAVRRFQRRNGLAVDGVVGPVTAARLGLAHATSEQRSPRRLPAILERIAQCESGGDPAIVSRDGRYRGKYQFSRATWRGLGGTGDPAQASEAEQDRRALQLYRQAGTTPWPNCA